MENTSRRRSTLALAILWGGCIALMIFMAIEVRARWGYSSTLARLRQLAGNESSSGNLSLEEIRKQFRGPFSEREVQSGGKRLIVLHWDSFISDYTIQLSVTPMDDLVAITTGPLPTELLTDTSSKVAESKNAIPSGVNTADDRVNAELVRVEEKSKADRAFSEFDFPERHDFDPAALDLVKKMFQEHPRSPLPSDRGNPAPPTVSEAEWLREQFVESYEKYGSKDDQWDKSAVEFLTAGAAALVVDRLSPDSASQAAEPGTSLLQAGCQDPLVQYVVAALYFRFNIDKAAVYLDQALEKFPDSRYPLDCVLTITLPHARRQNWIRLIQSYRQRGADPDQIRLYGTEPNHPARRYLLLGCLRTVPWTSFAKARDFLGAIDCVPQFDPYLKAMLTGRLFSSLAHVGDLNAPEIRGSGKDSRPFIKPAKIHHARYRHSLSAQAYYLDAWKLDPAIPEAAYGIIAETQQRRVLEMYAQNLQDHIELVDEEGWKCGWPEVRFREAMRFWFDQCLRGGFAFMPAYGQMLAVLQERGPEPEFSEHLLAFGRECLATRRFDTPVPLIYLDVLDTLRNSWKSDKAYQRPGVYEDVSQMVSEYFSVAQTDSDRNRLKSLAACVAIRAEQNDDARRILSELGERADRSVFIAQGVDLNAVRKMLFDKHPNHQLLPELDRPVFGIAFAGNDDTLLTAEGKQRTTTRWSLKQRAATGVFAEDGDLAALVAASPDGKLIATTGSGGTVTVWDAGSGDRLQTLQHDGQVQGMRFSPLGTRLATSVWSEEQLGGTLRVWDVATGEELARRNSPDSIFHEMAFVGGETTLAIATGSYLGRHKQAPGEISLWDLTNDRLTKTYRGLFDRHSNGFAVSADGKSLAAFGQGIRINRETGGEYYLTELRVVNLEHGDVGKAVIREPGGISAATFVGSGEILATAGPDRVIRIWSVPDSRLIAEMTGHRYNITALAASAESLRLASRDTSGQVKVWDLAGTATVSQAQGELLDFPFQTVFRVWADPEGRFVATGDARFGVMLWEQANGWKATAVFPLNERFRLRDFDFSPDGRLLAVVGEPFQLDKVRTSGDKEGFVELWDVASRKVIGQLDHHKKAVVCARFSPDSRMLATGGLDGLAVLWNLETRQPFDWGLLKNNVGNVHALSFSPDGNVLATGTQYFNTSSRTNGTVRIWDLPADRLAVGIRLIPQEVKQPFRVPGVHAVEFSADGKLLLAVDSENAFVLDATARETLVTAEGNLAAFAPLNHGLIVFRGNRVGKERLALWHLGGNQPPTEFQPPMSTAWTKVTPLPDGRNYLAVNGIIRVVVWDSVKNQLVDPFPDLKVQVKR